MTFNVNADLFRAAAVVISKEETRYYLNGVCIEPHPAGGVTLTATDGHRLFTAYDREGEASRTYIVKLDAAALKACKASRRETHPRRLLLAGDDRQPVSITDNDDTTVCHLAVNWEIKDATFPDWRRVVPRHGKGDKPVADWYNPDYLASFADIAGILSDGVKSIRVCSIQQGSPALVTFGNQPYQAVGVVMPIRGDDTDIDIAPVFTEIIRSNT